jgi:polyphosphate kinase 2 (PPK2 family)
VERFATKDQWGRAYREICGFEKSLTDEGMVLVKFWLHLSEDEQLRRFESREKDPLRRWKLTDEDWRNRRKRKAYERAVEDMLNKTEHPSAPWAVVEAENKRWARVRVLETVVAATEAGLTKNGVALPPPLAQKPGSQSKKAAAGP